ncbi:hypothetical protein ACIPW9_36280 [Streptomyces sp. NPDC090052]|uniref:hypothetical protein n=1 Tax=Streptomyces sp. NPDC090052 TaxID=3365931 RepID=UPI0038082A64
MALHPNDNVIKVGRPSSFADEALRRVLAAAPIDPREPGLVYDNADGTFEVLAIENPPKGGRRFLIRNIHTHATHSTGALWTASDRVLTAVAA